LTKALEIWASQHFGDVFPTQNLSCYNPCTRKSQQSLCQILKKEIGHSLSAPSLGNKKLTMMIFIIIYYHIN